MTEGFSEVRLGDMPSLLDDVRAAQQDAAGLCGCQVCVAERVPLGAMDLQSTPGWRYACEVCGNKRCPHHTFHRYACTNSNALGQVGVIGNEAALQAQRESVAAERAKREADAAQDAADLETGRALRRLRESGRSWAVNLYKNGCLSVGGIGDRIAYPHPTLPEAVTAALG